MGIWYMWMAVYGIVDGGVWHSGWRYGTVDGGICYSGGRYGIVDGGMV